MLYRLFLAVLLIIVSIDLPKAQESAREKARQHILALQQGTLVFIVPSSHRKIEVLTKQLNANTLDGKERKRMEEILNRTIAEQDSFEMALRKAVKEEYHFSKFTFESADSIPTRNDSGELASPYYFIKRGTTESGADALLITDGSGNTLNRPFPYYVRLVKISAVFDAFFGVPEFGWKDLHKVIRKLEHNLQKFYRSAAK